MTPRTSRAGRIKWDVQRLTASMAGAGRTLGYRRKERRRTLLATAAG